MGSGSNNPSGYGIRARHQGGRTYGTRQDHRADSAKFLVAQNERTDYRFCQKLSVMPEKQSIAPFALWSVLATGVALRPMAVNSDGFHYRLTIVKRMRPTLGDH